MIKWIACIVVGALIGTLLYLLLFQNPGPLWEAPPPIKGSITEAPPPRYEILYDRDTGWCNVITRSEHGLVNESLFSSKIVNECYKYTLLNEVE
jgi:hypothetical protein